MSESLLVTIDKRSNSIFVFLICYSIWLLLTGSLNSQELVVGAIVSATITLLFSHRLKILSGFRFSWLAPLYILSFLGVFFIALIRANLDLAMRILSPSLPINPRFVEIRTQLKSPLGKLLLANTITLTPGTLTIDVIDDCLLVHWVYCPPGTNMQKATQNIAASFEKHLSRFLL